MHTPTTHPHVKQTNWGQLHTYTLSKHTHAYAYPPPHRNEGCHTHTCHTYETSRLVTQMIEPCHTCAWVTSDTRDVRGVHLAVVRRVDMRIMCHVRPMCHVTRLIQSSYTTRVIQSSYTYASVSSTYTKTYTRTHTHAHTHTHARTHARTHAYTRTHARTHT